MRTFWIKYIYDWMAYIFPSKDAGTTATSSIPDMPIVVRLLQQTPHQIHLVGKMCAAEQLPSHSRSLPSHLPSLPRFSWLKGPWAMSHAAFIAVILLLHILSIPVEAKVPIPEPNYTNYAQVARWAISRAQYGTLSTVSLHLSGVPWGNIVSTSDGIGSQYCRANSTGVPYFFLTTLDATAQDLVANTTCSFAVSEATFMDSLGCQDHGASAEDPTCVRVTLSGNMVLAEEGSPQDKFGRQALFSKHPVMAGWPVDHNWGIYFLNISNVFVLDFYGGAVAVTTAKYLAAKP